MGAQLLVRLSRRGWHFNITGFPEQYNTNTSGICLLVASEPEPEPEPEPETVPLISPAGMMALMGLITATALISLSLKRNS